MNARLSPLLLLGFCCGSLAAQAPDPVGERKEAVESGLLPRVFVVGEITEARTIRERMAEHHVPGASVAVMRAGRVEWAEGYGVRRVGEAGRVKASTLFQAASIGKPITAAAVLRLVDRGELDLDTDVNEQLRSWTLPVGEHATARPVTIRDILSHTAGLTVSGFAGYAVDDALPTAIGVLEGRGNSSPVRVDAVPGTGHRYSGGGYTILQVLLEDVGAAPFTSIMAREILRPLGMTRSTFAQPLPTRLTEDVAFAHDEGGTLVEGGWHVYPELAAAGLWSTPTELARFALGVRAAYSGMPGAFLEETTAREMLTADRFSFGLGFQIAGEGEELLFLHTGSNLGYKGILALYPTTGDGVAILTNGEAGGDLMMEIVRAVSAVYEWPNFKPKSGAVVPLDPADAERFVGKYVFADEPERVVRVALDDDALVLVRTDDRRTRLLPTSETEFFLEWDGTSVVFEPEGREGELEWDGEARARRIE